MLANTVEFMTHLVSSCAMFVKNGFATDGVTRQVLTLSIISFELSIRFVSFTSIY